MRYHSDKKCYRKRFQINDMTNFEKIINTIQFNEDGLVPVIAQEASTGEVLMMAWMNKQAVEHTLREKQVCYFSRSRQKLWRKGESSGQTQQLVSLTIDCDGDTLLAKVEQIGVACHTGRKNCFFNEIDGDTIKVTQEVQVKPEELYSKK